jgi:3'-phosphoadenosine 5'-phosphosulfate sulfotransferase (PAPS reductase)/FAD synthetase
LIILSGLFLLPNFPDAFGKFTKTGGMPMNDDDFMKFLDNDIPLNQNIFKYLMVTRNKLRQHKRIAISYSAGSDSDIMADLIELVKPDDGCGEIRYVFFDTSLEYDATLRHIAETEQKYGIKVERIKARKSIPAACREHGIPFISKDVSKMLYLLQKNGFDWNDLSETATPEKYGRGKSALDWYLNRRPPSANGKNIYNINRFKLLREYLMSYPPAFAISEKCCDFAKKNVSRVFDRQFNPDLKIIGMRQAEGGRRVGSVKNCFTPAKDSNVANYRPLWYWNDEDKRIYKEWRGRT